jgi:hypothetical protein
MINLEMSFKREDVDSQIPKTQMTAPLIKLQVARKMHWLLMGKASTILPLIKL